MSRAVLCLLAACLLATLPGTAAADHPGETFTGALPGAFQGPFTSGGEGATWEGIATFPTANPHTDLDIFTQGGNMYVAAGVLGTGPNGGGQTIFQLLDEAGEVAPSFVSTIPTAMCPNLASGITGLQHDVEATPKGDVILNTTWGDLPDRRDAQLLLDATDAPGRCHDNGFIGLSGTSPNGGLEIIDITDIENPVEIGLTSHIGEAHTVNVDPKRPYIAYAVTSDGTAVSEDGERENETSTDNLDGFEVVDLRSCMDFPADATVEQKRGIDPESGDFLEGQGCRPDVYRYRFELGWTRGTLNADAQTGCHELEVYPDDKLACAAPDGTLLLDMSGAFDDMGTPDDYSDDVINGDPLPCAVRSSTSTITPTDAPIIDCVTGQDDVDLTVSSWLELGSPSLEGVELIGFVNHGGRAGGATANNAGHPVDQDIAVSHEAELTNSGKFLLATDERGGGIVPPDAACPVPGTQPPTGNGGIHAFRVDELFTEYPGDPATEDLQTIAERARTAYAETPDGEKPVYRALPRVPSPSLCTAHVFHIIPDQNRIFMGWYSQGTQVVDYIEHLDGTFEWREAGWFIPVGANTWVGAVFKFEENDDGSFSYWGVSTDFGARLGIDVWKVTLPPPIEPVTRLAGPTRLETAVEVSKATFPEDDSAGAVVLARWDEFADAMAGTPFAARENAPLLLTPPNELNDAVRTEIDRVLPAGGTIYVLGETDAISADIERQLSDAGYDVQRIGGPTRIETAVLIADRLGNPQDVFVTRGYEFADAITAGAAAVRIGAAVILSLEERPHPATDAYLAAHPNTNLVAIGGPAAQAYPDAEEISGPAREETSVLVAQRYFPDVSAVGIARRDQFPDSLTGAVHIGTLGGPMLLTPPDELDDVIERYLCDNAGPIGAAVIYGGPVAISEGVQMAVEDRMRGLGC